jgi:hypothetical protein
LEAERREARNVEEKLEAKWKGVHRMKRKWYVMQASSLLLSSETNLEESCI